MARDGWNPKKPRSIPISQAASQKGKVNLTPEAINLLVQQQGVRVRVYRTTFCPNVKSIDGGEHEIDCPLCFGNGFLDRKPIEALAFIQSQSLEKLHEANGYWDGNSVSATLQLGISLQYFTLVELCDFEEVFIERIKRQAGDSDRLKYRASCINLLADSTGKEYFAGVDFDLSEEGDVKWKAGKGPQMDAIYSINYEAAIQFRAVQAMHVARFAQVRNKGVVQMIKLNEQWMLQKEYLVERTDKLGRPLSPNQIRDVGEE